MVVNSRFHQHNIIEQRGSETYPCNVQPQFLSELPKIEVLALRLELQSHAKGLLKGVDDENDGVHKKEQSPRDSDQENSPETIFDCDTAWRVGCCLPSGRVFLG